MDMYFEGERIPIPQRIGNWLLQEKLGSGFSGAIWRAYNPYTGQMAALKLQHIDHECPTNRYERLFYPSLQGGIGMPTLWSSGQHGLFDYLVIDLLGPSLDNLYRQCKHKVMDLRTVLSIGMQVISRLEFMHSRGLLHRDIQLGNCVVGLGQYASTIFMIDFGFSKFYIDPNTHKHIPDSRKKRDFIGNYWFSSVNVHCRGRVPSRRDDLEALALMLIHLLTPNGLPWTRNGVPKYSTQEDLIVSEKLRARPDDLCRGLPDVFEDFLRYCRRLKFADCPDYGRWRNEFAALAYENGWTDQFGRVIDEFVWPPVIETPHIKAGPSKQNNNIDVEAVLGDIANMNLNEYREPVLNSLKAHGTEVEGDSDDSGEEEEFEDEDDEPDLSSSSEQQSLRQSEPHTPLDGGDASLPPSKRTLVIAVSDERSTSMERDKISAPPIQVLSCDHSTDTASANSSSSSRDELHPSYHSGQHLGQNTLPDPGHRVATPTRTTQSPLATQTAGTSSQPSNSAREVIVISSGDEDDRSSVKKLRLETRWLKAAAINRLTLQLSKAVDNTALSRLMQQFIDVLHSNSSKFVTKEGFAFLDGLERQLSGPGVFVVRPSAEQQQVTRNSAGSNNSLDGVRRRRGHAETIKLLRQKLLASLDTFSNTQAGEMVGAFTKALRNSAGRTVTKDGFAFLAGIQTFLQRT